MNFEVGQKVWFTEPLFHRGKGLVEGEVTKVGNKYVYIKNIRDFKFDKKTLQQVGDTNYKGRIYQSKEDYFNEHELNANMQIIRKTINDYGKPLSLNQTREILKILNDN